MIIPGLPRATWVNSVTVMKSAWNNTVSFNYCDAQHVYPRLLILRFLGSRRIVYRPRRSYSDMFMECGRVSQSTCGGSIAGARYESESTKPWARGRLLTRNHDGGAEGTGRGWVEVVTVMIPAYD
jgi:hypothetical protein